MCEKFGRETNRLIERIEQTMSRMSNSKSALINALIKHVVHKVKATEITDMKSSAIYRAKRNLIQNQEKIIELSGLYSPLFAREKTGAGEEPFSLIVNIDGESLKRGYLWFSPVRKKEYRPTELDYFVLDNDEFIPYKLTALE